MERSLYCDGQPVALGARAVALLSVLVARHGRLVSKAELLDMVWPGLVVEENNLQVQMSALRKALGARMIVTVPGRGYRFVEPLLDAAQPRTRMVRDLDPATGVPVSPGLDTPGIVPAGLPPAGPRLMGRDADQAALDALLPTPLVTLVGPAGIGKTALALSAAQRWRQDRPDGATWVDLSELRSTQQVLAAVSRAMGLPLAVSDPLRTLVLSLKRARVLIVLDNAEQAHEAAASLAASLLAEAPGVRLLVTSQRPLKVAGERVFRLGPLSIPAPDVAVEVALSHGAVALFVEQVQAIDRRFRLLPDQVPQVVRLCQRLDGLALAIKLAAARVPLLGLPGVSQRLDERFRLLRHPQTGVTSRHHTLAAALDWSHGLLSEAEQALFRRLAVFSGGFPLALASCLGRGGGDAPHLDEWEVLDTLGALVERSLLAVDGGESDGDPARHPPRYRLLDCTRDYAWLQLEASGEAAWLRRQHAFAVADWVDSACEALWHEGDAAWLARHAPEVDNVRSALDWAQRQDPALAVRLLGAAGPLLRLLGLTAEARATGDRVCEVAQGWLSQPAGADAEGALKRRFWLELGCLQSGVDQVRLCTWVQLAAQASREAGDDRDLYLALCRVAGSGMLEEEDALATLRELARLERPDWPPRLQAQRLIAEVGVLRGLEHMADARRTCQTLLVKARAAGLDGILVAGLSELSAISLALGDTDAALRLSQHVLSRSGPHRGPCVVHALATVACVAFVRGDLHEARACLGDFVTACRVANWEGLGLHAGLLALLAALEGRHEAAARLLGYTEQAGRHRGTRDVLGVYAWSRALALVHDALEPTVCQRLFEHGRQLDPESVCVWGLAEGIA